jgi:hypothetical protein
MLASRMGMPDMVEKLLAAGAKAETTDEVKECELLTCVCMPTGAVVCVLPTPTYDWRVMIGLCACHGLPLPITTSNGAYAQEGNTSLILAMTVSEGRGETKGPQQAPAPSTCRCASEVSGEGEVDGGGWMKWEGLGGGADAGECA